MSAQVRHEIPNIGGAATMIADTVDLQGEIAQPETPVQLDQQRYHLDVHISVVESECLAAELMVLAKTPTLRALVAKHWVDVIQLHRLRPSAHSVLEIRPNDRRGS